MSELMAKFSPGEFIALAAVVMGPLIAITAIIATQWRQVRITEMKIILKQQMLDKGMSPAEIEQVMSVGNAALASVGPTGNPEADRVALAQRMIDEGYEAADIELVLNAYNPGARPAAEKPLAKTSGA
ncbi:MAG: hypothetical protein FJ303_25720 [Planctomycetes bacterium]|nr:hypothetical protein [Planctomycetota bacterium]